MTDEEFETRIFKIGLMKNKISEQVKNNDFENVDNTMKNFWVEYEDIMNELEVDDFIDNGSRMEICPEK